MTRDITEFLHFEDARSNWMWVRFRLPRNEKTKGRISIKGEVYEETQFASTGEKLVKRWIANYPIDTSFYTVDQSLPIPTKFIIQGITVLTSRFNMESDNDALKDNYVYELGVLRKIFHSGPLMLFNREKYIDEWKEELMLLPQMSLVVNLIGNPFTPMKNMDCMIGIKGVWVRAVQ
jgi:hypothetical protein